MRGWEVDGRKKSVLKIRDTTRQELRWESRKRNALSAASLTMAEVEKKESSIRR